MADTGDPVEYDSPVHVWHRPEYVTGHPFTTRFRLCYPCVCTRRPSWSTYRCRFIPQGEKMKFELKPTIIRAGVIGGVIAAILAAIGAFVPFVGCLGFLLYLGIGAYTIMIERQAGAAANEMPQDGIDGAIAGFIAGLIGGIVSLILVLVNVGVSAGSSSSAATSVAVVGGLGAIGVLCGAFIGGAVWGAIGGIGDAVVMNTLGGMMAAP